MGANVDWRLEKRLGGKFWRLQKTWRRWGWIAGWGQGTFIRGWGVLGF